MGDSSAVANDTSVADFDEVRTRFVAYLDASGCSPNTARAYGHDLTHLRSFLVEHSLDWTTLTPARPDRYAPRPVRNVAWPGSAVTGNGQSSAGRNVVVLRLGDHRGNAGPAEPDAGQQEYQQAFSHRSAPAVL